MRIPRGACLHWLIRTPLPTLVTSDRVKQCLICLCLGNTRGYHPLFQQCLHIKGPDFKGRYLYAKLVYDDTDVNSGLLPNTTIPRGGGYWVQDIVENLPEYPPFLDDFEDFQSSMWLTRLSQKVGMCVPSGCSGLDVFENYRQLYEHINAKLEKTSYTELSLTEDYFYEGYLEGTILDGYENILPASWTWGQWLYV